MRTVGPDSRHRIVIARFQHRGCSSLLLSSIAFGLDPVRTATGPAIFALFIRFLPELSPSARPRSIRRPPTIRKRLFRRSGCPTFRHRDCSCRLSSFARKYGRTGFPPARLLACLFRSLQLFQHADQLEDVVCNEDRIQAVLHRRIHHQPVHSSMAVRYRIPCQTLPRFFVGGSFVYVIGQPVEQVQPQETARLH